RGNHVSRDARERNLKPLLLEDRERVASLDVGNRRRARHRSHAAHDVLTGKAADGRVDVTNRRAYSEPCAEAEDDKRGQDLGAVSVNECFDASWIRNTHRSHAVPSNGCAVPITMELPRVCRLFVEMYCRAVM